jgi:DNA-binding NarL/FixJ family response regulator
VLGALLVKNDERGPMPAERVSMRRVREILRLKHGGASDRQIARSLSLARSTAALTMERVAAAGLRSCAGRSRRC